MKQIKLAGILWDAENLSQNGKEHFTWSEALEAAKSVGKRLPTRKEFEKLCKLPNIWGYQLKGRWFAETLKDFGNLNKSLFLPAAGRREYTSGQLYNPGVVGSYWSATAYGDSSFGLSFLSGLCGFVYPEYYYYRANGFSVRCVAK